MSSFPPRIFLLSPARLDGKRAHLLFHPVTMFPVARALHSTAGAPIGEIFTFLSGLYFRGKLAYAEAFARPPRGLNSGVFVITPNGGLLPPSVRVTLDDLARLAKTDIDPSAKEFRKPLQKDAKALAQALGPRGEPILLGSIATRKYLDVLLAAFPQELLFPSEFVGRGDMSRGGSHASLRGCAPGTHLRASARNYPAGRPATEAAPSVDPILNQHASKKQPISVGVDRWPPAPVQLPNFRATRQLGRRLAVAADQSSLTATELIEFQSIKRRNGDAMRHAQRAVASNLIELHLIPAAKSDQNIKPAGR